MYSVLVLCKHCSNCPEYILAFHFIFACIRSYKTGGSHIKVYTRMCCSYGSLCHKKSLNIRLIFVREKKHLPLHRSLFLQSYAKSVCVSKKFQKFGTFCYQNDPQKCVGVWGSTSTSSKPNLSPFLPLITSPHPQLMIKSILYNFTAWTFTYFSLFCGTV